MVKEENINDLKLMSTNNEDLGCIKRAIKYKYLGVNLKLKEACNIFDFKRTEMVARAKSYAAKIITLARESYDPCRVASALWKQVATEGILYGIQAVSITKEIMKKLDSIQAGVGAFILGVRKTCSHEAIRKELGWKSMSAIICTRKLQYWERLASLKKENWANMAFRECDKAKGKTNGDAWLSHWRKEILAILEECEMWDPFGYHVNKRKSIRKGVDEWEKKRTEIAMKGSSLNGLPTYKKTRRMQTYIDYTEASIAIAKFRLGDARLGNRETPAIKDCRLCSSGRENNNEAHVIFTCCGTKSIIEGEMPKLQKFKEKHAKEKDEKKKLRLLLGGDKSKYMVLVQRGKELAALLRKIEIIFENNEFFDLLQEMKD